MHTNNIQVHKHVHTSVQTNRYKCKHAHTKVYKHIHTSIENRDTIKYTNTQMLTNAHTQVYRCIQKYTNTHTNSQNACQHTHVEIYRHNYTHTHTHTKVCNHKHTQIHKHTFTNIHANTITLIITQTGLFHDLFIDWTEDPTVNTDQLFYFRQMYIYSCFFFLAVQSRLSS